MKEERNDIKLIYFIINKLKLSYMQDEIIDIAFIGYTKAVNTYKKENSAFGNYVYTCIKNEINKYFKSLEYDVRKVNVNCKSLNEKELGRNEELIETIKDSFNLENEITKKILIEEINRIAKESLTERQYAVFELYFLKDFKDVEIANILGVTRTRIAQLKLEVLKKLKNNKRIQRMKEDQ